MEPDKPSSSPLLTAETVGRCIEERWLWRNLSFDLHAGETLAVSGPSGSGKTLLLRGIALLDPLTEGRITFRGHDLEDWVIPAYRTRMLYMHQRPALMEGTVEENLRRVFAFNARRARRYDRDRAVSLLERLGRVAAMLEQKVDGLSGGEAQVVAMVRALLVDPDVLLLDEPTASLDEDAALCVEALMRDWKQEAPERAIVWVSHSPAQRDRVADRRLVLSVGVETEAGL